MNRFLRVSTLFLMVAAVASGSCFLTGLWLSRRQKTSGGSRADTAHLWVHRELRLTLEQDAALAPIEQRYAAKRDQLTAAIRQANAELARAIREDRANSPKVGAAVDKIHQAQGELQKVTLEHVFEMRQALFPAQYDKLLHLTAAALEADDR